MKPFVQNQEKEKGLEAKDQQVPQERTEALIRGQGARRIEISQKKEKRTKCQHKNCRDKDKPRGGELLPTHGTAYAQNKPGDPNDENETYESKPRQ